MKTDNYALRVFIVSLLVVTLGGAGRCPVDEQPCAPAEGTIFRQSVDIPVVPQIDHTGIGTIAGVVRNAAGKPVASATVTARQLDGAGIRATISGSDGIYSYPDLPSGMYRVATDAIGATVALTPSIQVTNGHATRFDLSGAPNLSMPTAMAVAQPATAAPAKAPAAAPAAENNKFWSHWLNGQKATNLDNQLRAQAAERAEKAAAAAIAPAEPVEVASLGNAPIAAAFDKPAPEAPAPDPHGCSGQTVPGATGASVGSRSSFVKVS